MIEITGNIFTSHCNSICITTNGIVKQNGAAIMGAGIALTARNLIPNIDFILGEKLNKEGNKVHYLCEWNKKKVYSFPTKHHFKDKSDIKLIEKSCHEILDIWNLEDIVGVPRPGCNNGGLNWDDVKIVVEKILKFNNFEIYNLS